MKNAGCRAQKAFIDSRLWTINCGLSAMCKLHFISNLNVIDLNLFLGLNNWRYSKFEVRTAQVRTARNITRRLVLQRFVAIIILFNFRLSCVKVRFVNSLRKIFNNRRILLSYSNFFFHFNIALVYRFTRTIKNGCPQEAGKNRWLKRHMYADVFFEVMVSNVVLNFPPLFPTQKKALESTNARLALVMKSGKFCLGYKQTLKSLRQGKAKLIIIASNTPQLR